MKYSFGLFCFVLIVFSSISFSDTLFLSSGDQLIGAIQFMDDREIVIDVNGVPLKVMRSYVVKILRDEERTDTPPSYVSPINIQPSTETVFTPNNLAPDSSQLPSTNVSPATLTVDLSAPEPLLPVVLPKGKVFQVALNGARFRKGPSLDHEIIKTLLGQTILLEIEFLDNWLHAKTLDGLEGWVHPSSILPMENLPCLVTGDRLHVREAPDDLSRSLERLRSGDVVVKLQERGDWWFVLCGDQKAGWCSRQYLSPMADKNTYVPTMRMLSNADANMPVLVDRKPDSLGIQRVTFTLRDVNLAMSGKTRLLVFYRDPIIFMSESTRYVGESILQQDRLDNSLSLLQVGLPEDLAVNNIGADLLTLLGERVAEGWKYEILMPDSVAISFGFVYQKSEKRGTVVVIQ